MGFSHRCDKGSNTHSLQVCPLMPHPKKSTTNLINQKPLAVHVHPLPLLTYNRQHRYASSIMGIP